MAERTEDSSPSNHDGEFPGRASNRSAAEAFKLLAGVLIAAWATLQVIYFLRSNRLLWNAGPDAPLGVFSGLTAGPWTFSLANTPPLMFLAAVAMAAITTAFGMLVIRALDVPLGRCAQLAFGFAIGMGLSGILFKLLTMAGLLNIIAVWALWIVLFGALAFIMIRRRGAEPWRAWHADSRVWLGVDDESTDHLLTRRSREELAPESPPEKIFLALGLGIVAVITLLTFWHALFYPETYWDSLILYLGYGRITFLEGAFPFKATAQVGIGLGANYPHLFSNYGAVGSAMFGSWSDLHQRLAAPLAGLAATLLIYETVVLVTGRRVLAMVAAVLFRATPHVIAYTTYASDYAIAIFFTAAFFYAAALVARSRLPGAVLLMTFLPAAAMHINYLMGILWVPWAAGMLLAHGGFRPKARPVPEVVVGGLSLHDPQSPGVFDPVGGGVLPVLRSRVFLIALVVCMALGGSWYVRNWVLTGNPVYSFFPQVFRSSINLNPEVLESADLEWFRNGDGVGRIAEQFVDIEQMRPTRNIDDPDFQREATLRHRIAASFLFWQGYETFRFNEETQQLSRGNWIDRLSHLILVAQPTSPGDSEQDPRNILGGEFRMLQNPHVYKMSPLVMGFAIPGFLLSIALLIVGNRSSRIAPVLDQRAANTIAGMALILTLGLFAYHYLLADYYLYQMLPVVVPLVLLAGIGFAFWLGNESARDRLVAAPMLACVLIAGMVPGIAMSLINFKVPGGGIAFGQQYSAHRLDIFRSPGMEPALFWRLRFGADIDMIEHINERLGEQPLLTHDNRHYLFDPAIELVHLDDWDVQQQTWSEPDPLARLAFHRDRGIHYYLRIPMEFKHPINEQAGLQQLIDEGHLTLVFSAGENQLYQFDFSAIGPPNDDTPR